MSMPVEGEETAKGSVPKNNMMNGKEVKKVWLCRGALLPSLEIYFTIPFSMAYGICMIFLYSLHCSYLIELNFRFSRLSRLWSVLIIYINQNQVTKFQLSAKTPILFEEYVKSYEYVVRSFCWFFSSAFDIYKMNEQ